ncbi:MAG: hypothetical protein AAB410_01615 [Patescibacteria group bacterium]
MSDTKDRHRFRSVVNVKLTEEQLITLDLFLPRQEGFEAKARYLLTVMAEIVFSEAHFVKPEGSTYGVAEDYSIRVPYEVHARLKKYANEQCVSLGRQATELLATGLTLLEERSFEKSFTKEEFKRQMQRELGKPSESSRMDDIRQGFRFIWRALSKH